MLTTIARKEFVDIVRDGRFRLTGGVIGALLLVSLASGWIHYRDVRAQHEAAQEASRRHWVDQGDKNPHSAAHYGIYAFKPRLALSFVDKGVDPYTGTSVWLEAHRQNDFVMRPAQDASAAQRIGTLTAAGVVQTLLPLLIILLAFGAFTAEREQGTLQQYLAQGGSRTKLALGKSIGVGLALMLLLVPAAIVGAVALLLGSSGPLAPMLARAATLSLAFLAYLTVFVLLAVAVSARMPSSRTALLVLLAFWMFNGYVAPRVATDISRSLHPTPSAFEFGRKIQEQLRTGIDGADPVDGDVLLRQVLAEHGVEQMEDLPVNFDGIRLQASEEFATKVYDKNYGELWDTFERQASVHATMSFVAPMLAIRNVSMGLAGTDVHQHRDFAEAAESYRRELVREMNDDMAVNSLTGDWAYRADARLWESVQPFEYEAPSLARVIASNSLSLALLVLWLVGAAVAAFLSAGRAPVA